MTTSSASPTTTRGTAAEPHDSARQWTVLVSAIVAVAVSFLGSGAVVGTPVNQVADGALSSSATLVAPAGPAFAIWGVIYTGLILLAVLQVLPSRRTDPRQRRTGWWTAASLLLNAAWILVIQVEQIVAAFVVIAALAAVLVVAMVRLGERPATTAYERVVVDGTLGLYLGWVCIATVANGAAALVVLGVDPTGTAAVAMAVLVLVVAGGIGVLLAVGLGGRLAPALSLAWGLAWVAVARVTGEPTSTAVATTAALAAAVTLGSSLVVAASRRAQPS
jgi:hypothetical protein